MKAIQPGLIQFYDPNTGNPVANGSVATYDTISYSPKTSYADVNGETENPNPVPLDSTGSCYLFGDGSYNLNVFDNTGTLVREFQDVGIETTSGYVVGPDSAVLSPGDGGTGTFTDDEMLAIYADTEAKELKGVASIGDVVMEASGEGGGVAGSYDLVQQMYSDSSSAPPDNVIVVDGPIDGYDTLSNRLYQWTDEGNFGVDPQSDTYDQSGKGENWTDLLRLAVTEELRVTKAVMRWDDCKDFLGNIEVDTPIMVFGSDGILYRAVGSPTAEQLATVDPVTESPRAVWTYVYDPTTTAAYPPGYYSPQAGVKFHSASAIKVESQAVKLRSASSGLFENDGELEETYYKSLASFSYSVGTSGTPTGSYASASAYSGTGWLAVYIIRTDSTEVAVATALTTTAPADMLTVINGLAAESSAGRTWSYYRRVGYIYCTAGVIREWVKVGQYYGWKVRSGPTTFASTSTASPGAQNTLSLLTQAPPSSYIKASLLSFYPGAPSTPDSILVRIIGNGETASGATGYDAYMLVTEDSQDMIAMEFQRQVNGSGELDVYLQPTNGTASWSFGVTVSGWTDILDD